MSQDIIDALLRERAGYAAKGDADSAAQVDEQLAHYGYEGVDELEPVEPREAGTDNQEDPLVELRKENDTLRTDLAAVTSERDELAVKAAERDDLAKKVESLEAAAAARAADGGPTPVAAKPSAAKSTRSK